ncbi:MAG: class I SAM-dependent methyltransferase [Candidatus Omnitrophica bacterium]|nr:class I SAM-dependent methyltransferase [Candidatus Omnitrophota bacterium]
MDNNLEKIKSRPALYEFYTAKELWNDEHTSKQMLSYHLNGDVDISSRRFEFIDKSVDWIASTFNVSGNTKIADFGCGPGLYAHRLARRNAKVTGIDFSKRSIDYAKDTAAKEKLAIKYINTNYLVFDTDERFDLILMIMCDYCALSTEQREKILQKFYSLLNPGGSVLLDVYSIVAYEEREEQSVCEENLLDGFWAEGEYKGYLNTFKYEEDKVILDKYTIIEQERVRTIYNWLKYFTPEELEKEFAEARFKIEKFYSDVAGTPFDVKGTEFAVIATK